MATSLSIESLKVGEDFFYGLFIFRTLKDNLINIPLYLQGYCKDASKFEIVKHND